MSRENVKLVRSLYKLGARSPLGATPEEIDRVFRDYADEDLEIHLPEDYPEGEPVFRGREGIGELTAMLQEVWGEWRQEPVDFLDAGSCIVTFVRIHAEGGASGVAVDIDSTHVWTLRSGRVVSLHAYRDRSKALEAAGLSESAMSQDNVENARRGIDAWNRDDLDAWLAGFAPDAELHTTGRFADRGVYRGQAGLKRYWAEIREDMEETSLAVSDLRSSCDKVFQAVTGSGQGKRSRAPVEQPMWLVTTFRDGLAVRVETYVDSKEALEAAGLSE